MIDFQCSELVLNARLAKKLRNGIRLALALVLVSLLFLIFGQGLNTWRFYSYFAVPAFLAAGLCLTYASPCLWIMIIQWRRLSIGRYELSLSHEGIVRKHYRGASLMSQEQWSPSDITQVCISRSVLGREQTLVTFAWFLRALFFGDELYFSVYLVDRQHREHWLLTSTDSEQIRLVYQELSHWLPFASRQDYLDAATHVLRLSPRQSEEGSYHAEFGRAQHLFFAGFMLTGLSLGTGVFAYSCYRNSAASGAWLRSTGTMLNQRVETKVTDGEEIR